jgi:predicted DNA binding CopG/RHH family protein
MVLPDGSEITMTTTSATKRGFRGGRPKLEPQDRRTPYGVRLSKRELQQVRERAEAEGMDLSVYCRQAILSSRTQRTVPAINRKTWFELSELSEAVVSLAKQATSDVGQPSGELLRDLSLLLKATRLELLGVYHVQEEDGDR